jgi:hypothetical protein
MKWWTPVVFVATWVISGLLIKSPDPVEALISQTAIALGFHDAMKRRKPKKVSKSSSTK